MKSVVSTTTFLDLAAKLTMSPLTRSLILLGPVGVPTTDDPGKQLGGGGAGDEGGLGGGGGGGDDSALTTASGGGGLIVQACW